MLNTFCPGLGSNQDLLRGSQTLYRVAIKVGLYRKAVQVCIIPNMCGDVRYNTHLYCLAVKAGFYSDAVECLTATQKILVRSSAGTKGV